MQCPKNILKENKLLIILYLIFLAFGITGLILLNKGELHLFLNGYHTPFYDLFFQFMTFLGEWFPFVVIGIIMIFKLGDGIGALAAQLLSGLITQVVKRICAAPRPMKYFSENFPDVSLPLPEGFSPHLINSFPSGHTSSIFALLIFMALMTKNNFIKALLLIVAILVGYSRIYLSQHFALDVVVGSFVGSTAAFFIWYIVPQNRRWYQYSPLQSLIAHCKKDQSK
jgi:membrane-associated phospholipid phosphatase